MAHRVRGMNKAPLPPELVGRPNQWWFEVEAPLDQPFTSDTLSGTAPITLPPGTHVRVRSGIARVETVVVMNAQNDAIYDTLTGVARPSVTAGAYRQGPRDIEVAVVFLKRWFGDIPSLRSLCDEEGFIVCAEPPGGLIDDVVGCDFLHQRPSNTVIRRAARREIREEFGHVPILSLRVCRYPLASLAIAKASTFQAFVELDPTSKPRAPRPEEAEQIVDRTFLPLEEVLRRCAKIVHKGIFWGRESTHTWKLLEIYLRGRAERLKKKL